MYFFSSDLTLPLLKKVPKSWTSNTLSMMSFVVNCVRHLSLLFTVTSALVCVGEHLLDKSKLYIVVPIKHRQSIRTNSYPECQIHTTNLCELHCEQYDIPVCVQSVSSKKHKTHDVAYILKYLNSKNKALSSRVKRAKKIHLS